MGHVAGHPPEVWERIRAFLEPETGKGTAALIGSSMLPGVGTAIDVADIAAGIEDRDPSRVGIAALGAALPFVSSSGIRALSRVPGVLSRAIKNIPENIDSLRYGPSTVRAMKASENSMNRRIREINEEVAQLHHEPLNLRPEESALEMTPLQLSNLADHGTLRDFDNLFAGKAPMRGLYGAQERYMPEVMEQVESELSRIKAMSPEEMDRALSTSDVGQRHLQRAAEIRARDAARETMQNRGFDVNRYPGLPMPETMVQSADDIDSFFSRFNVDVPEIMRSKGTDRSRYESYAALVRRLEDEGVSTMDELLEKKLDEFPSLALERNKSELDAYISRFADVYIRRDRNPASLFK